MTRHMVPPHGVDQTRWLADQIAQLWRALEGQPGPEPPPVSPAPSVEILGRSGCFLGLVGSGPYVATESIEVELSARSTIRVSGMCVVANATTLEVVPYAENTSSYQRPVWRSTTATAELHSAHISYVVTLDAGIHELGFMATTDSSNGSAYGIDLVVGPNTETWTPGNCLG